MILPMGGGRGGGGGFCMMSLPVWLPGPMFLLGRGVSAWSHVLSGGLSVQGGLCPVGDSVGERSLSGRVCQVDPPDRPPYGEERTVCIVLECFLVILFTFINL